MGKLGTGTRFKYLFKLGSAPGGGTRFIYLNQAPVNKI